MTTIGEITVNSVADRFPEILLTNLLKLKAVRNYKTGKADYKSLIHILKKTVIFC
ncbi:hypothetical protein AAOGI_01410 [Agarivorans albus]